jgi:hypothetical protein
MRGSDGRVGLLCGRGFRSSGLKQQKDDVVVNAKTSEWHYNESSEAARRKSLITEGEADHSQTSRKSHDAKVNLHDNGEKVAPMVQERGKRRK